MMSVVLVSANTAFADWHTMSQSQRDSTLFSAGLADYGKTFTGLSCKEWVRAVIYRATGYHVLIGSTNGTGYVWNYDGTNDDDHVIEQYQSIGDVQFMDVIQMSPVHTAFVVSTTATHMTWLDCNWVGAWKIGIHSMSFADFSSTYGTAYTIYHIE